MFFIGKVVLVGSKRFHGLHDDLKIIGKKLTREFGDIP